jgi:hypothetical protein
MSSSSDPVLRFPLARYQEATALQASELRATLSTLKRVIAG